MTEMTEAELMREFTKRAKACQLQVDCLGAGNINSEICIIAEAPGEHEANMKMPLVGGSGRLLWDTLRPFDVADFVHRFFGGKAERIDPHNRDSRTDE